MARRVRIGLVLGAALVAAAIAPSRTHAEQAPDIDAITNAAFHSAYNLDFDDAIATARKAVALAPQNPRAHRTLAGVLWLHIVFLRGAVTVDHYLGGVSKSQLSLPPPDPAMDKEFKQEIAAAIDLAEAEVKAKPKDIVALDNVGVAYGVEASYTASVEGSLVPAFRSAKHAYDAEEQVLDRDPKMIGAGVIVGTYRYLISTLAAPARMFVYLMGFGGGKELGISLVEKATQDADTHVEARTSLLLIYSREGRHADALRVVHELATEFPRNRLFTFEEGATAIRAGRMAEAEAALTAGLAAFDHDPRPKVPGERPLWLYKRGLARFAMNHTADAAADLELALHSGPVEWVRGRIILAQGRMDEAAGRTDAAMAKYRESRTIAEAIDDPIASAEDTRLLSKR